MNGDAATREFKFLIDEDGALTKDPAMPWYVGPPTTRIRICLINKHSGIRHVVRLERFVHKHSGRALDPLTGTKVWQNFGGPTSVSSSMHTVRDNEKYDRYTFDARFDGALFDPELVVDPPPRPHVAGKASGAKTAAKKTAKKAKGKGGKAKKAAKARRAATRSKKAKKAKKATRARKAGAKKR